MLVALVCINCEKVVEPITHGDYYITNNTTDKLHVRAFYDFNEEEDLLVNEINPGSKVHIFTFTEGTGGHVMPSNAWTDFYIYSGYISDSTIIYSCIENSDWEYEGTNNGGHLIYNLKIE